MHYHAKNTSSPGTLLLGICIVSLLIGDGLGQTNRRLSVPTPEEQLRSLGIETSPEGLRDTLENTNAPGRIFAVQFIKEQKDKTFTPQLMRLLHEERSSIRVEAAIALATWGETNALEVLRTELHNAKHTGLRLHVAGALADLGESQGFDFVKSTLLDEHSDQCYAASLMKKFQRFEKDGIEVLPVLLQAVDMARKKAEIKESEFQLRTAQSLFGIVAYDLERSDDTRALAKLRDAAASKDPVIRSTAERCVTKIEKRQQNPRRN